MNISEFFNTNRRCALGYSGGVDSAYLLYKAVNLGVDIKPYFVRSAFTTQKECDDALVFAHNLGINVEIIDIDILQFENVKKNDVNRCYFCKKHIFAEIVKHAKNDGYEVILEGTNASDDVSDRPGFKAISELAVISPLRICGVTKSEIRNELKNAGLQIWNKPSSACLATRIPIDTPISSADLLRVEKAESILAEMGFWDFRIRIFSNSAKLQLKGEQFTLAFQKRLEILNALSAYFDDILLDLKER